MSVLNKKSENEVRRHIQKLCQTWICSFFAKIINGRKLSIIFTESCILYVWQASEYASKRSLFSVKFYRVRTCGFSKIGLGCRGVFRILSNTCNGPFCESR